MEQAQKLIREMIMLIVRRENAAIIKWVKNRYITEKDAKTFKLNQNNKEKFLIKDYLDNFGYTNLK